MGHTYKTFIAVMSYLSVIVGLTVGKILQNYRNSSASIAFFAVGCKAIVYLYLWSQFVIFDKIRSINQLFQKTPLTIWLLVIGSILVIIYANVGDKKQLDLQKIAEAIAAYVFSLVGFFVGVSGYRHRQSYYQPCIVGVGFKLLMVFFAGYQDDFRSLRWNPYIFVNSMSMIFLVAGLILMMAVEMLAIHNGEDGEKIERR